MKNSVTGPGQLEPGHIEPGYDPQLDVAETALLCARMCCWDWNMLTGEDRFTGDTQAVFGCVPDPTYETGFRRLVHPDDLHDLERNIVECADQRKPWEGELRVIHPDGSVHWLFGRGRFFYDQDGRPVRMVGVNVDITEQKHRDAELANAKAGLQAQQAEFETLVDNIPVMLCYMREPGKVHWVNRAWEQRLGWVPEDGDIASLLYPDEELRKQVGKFIADASGQWREFSTRTKSGETIDTEFMNVLLPDGRNVGIGQDVTAQKRAIADLRESERRFRALSEQIPQLVWISDGDGRTLYYNQRWYEFTGQSAADSIGHGWRAVMHPDDVEPNQRQWTAAAEMNQEYENEVRLRRHDGEYCWFLVRAVPILNEKGKAARWFGTSTDITDRKRSQEALIRSEKLAMASRFASTVAHEINNPLTAVTNIHYLLAADETLPERVRQSLKMADNELRRVSHILRQTLAFYREHTKLQEVNMVSLCQEILFVFEQRLQTRRIRLEMDIPETLTLLTTAGELRQVLSNLVANSLDATPSGGRIVVRARLVERLRSRPMVRITIADTGCGISYEVSRHVFEPFFTTKESVGTGLGLWVSRQLVERNLGRIQMRSREGVGTVFTLEFPHRSGSGVDPLERPPFAREPDVPKVSSTMTPLDGRTLDGRQGSAPRDRGAAPTLDKV